MLIRYEQKQVKPLRNSSQQAVTADLDLHIVLRNIKTVICIVAPLCSLIFYKVDCAVVSSSNIVCDVQQEPRDRTFRSIHNVLHDAFCPRFACLI